MPTKTRYRLGLNEPDPNYSRGPLRHETPSQPTEHVPDHYKPQNDERLFVIGLMWFEATIAWRKAMNMTHTIEVHV